MRNIAILLIFFPLAFAQGTNSSLFRNWQSSWIKGGTPAYRGQYNFMVSLKSAGSLEHFCAGSIIKPQYILTAAQCVSGKPPSSMIVVVGSTRLIKRYGHKYAVLNSIIHPSYNPSTLKNDIALIKLSAPLQFTRTVNLIPLPRQDEPALPGTPCALMGWGKVSASASSFNKDLQMVEMRIIPTLKCLQSYLHVSVTYICASGGPTKAATKGDEGGPLICNGIQKGLYSGERTPGPGFSPPYATVFVSLSKYINWIDDNTRT